MSALLGTLEGVEGSECRVPLVHFASHSIPAPKGYSGFLVDNFPVSRSLVWNVSVPVEYRQRVVEASDGSVVLNFPAMR